MTNSIDVTGLSPESLRAVESLVQSLRVSEAVRPRVIDDRDEWLQRFDEWVNSRPHGTGQFDDSRESIYAGRGE